MERQNVLGTERRRLVSSRPLAASGDDSRGHRSGSGVKNDLNSQQFALPRIRTDPSLSLECDTDAVDSDDNPLSPAQGSRSGINLEPATPEPHLTLNSSLSSRPESRTKQQEKQALKLLSAVPEKTLGGTSDQENVPGLKVAQSQTPQPGTDAWEQDKLLEGMIVTAAVKASVAILLDREPKADQKNNSSVPGLDYSELCEAKPNSSLNLRSAETGSSPCPAVISVGTGETGSGVCTSSKSSLEDESTPTSFTSHLGNTRRARAKLSPQEKTGAFELAHADRFASPESRVCAGAAGAAFLHASHAAMTDSCHAEERTMSSALNTVEGGEAETSPSQLVCLANAAPAAAAAAGAGNSARAEEINPRVPSESASRRSEAVNPAGGRGKQEAASGEESRLEVASRENTEVNVNSPAALLGSPYWQGVPRGGVAGGKNRDAPISLLYRTSRVRAFQYLSILSTS